MIPFEYAPTAVEKLLLEPIPDDLMPQGSPVMSMLGVPVTWMGNGSYADYCKNTPLGKFCDDACINFEEAKERLLDVVQDMVSTTEDTPVDAVLRCFDE